MVFGVQKVIALITQVPDTGLMTIAEHVAIFDSLVGDTEPPPSFGPDVL